MRGWFHIDIRHGTRLAHHDGERFHICDMVYPDGHTRQDAADVLMELMINLIIRGDYRDSAWAAVPLPVVFETPDGHAHS